MTPMPSSESAGPITCYVTDRQALGITDPKAACEALLERIANAARGGVDWIQIREKDLGGRALAELVRRAMEKAPGTRILVNDRLDVAIGTGAAGVHLGAKSLPVAEVVKWRRAGNAPPGFLLGRSCHSLEEAVEAERAGADYIFFGPVFATPSKEEYGAPQGTAKLRDVCARLGLPVLAIGGVTAENFQECFHAGAAGIAAIRMFQEAKALEAIIARVRKK
jgi:thiamine-phosphate pyrophosphorylase